MSLPSILVVSRFLFISLWEGSGVESRRLLYLGTPGVD